MAPLPLQHNPDLPKNRQGGICHFLNLQEDNIRFMLLAVFLYVYLAFGAFVFQAVEEEGENKMRKDFEILYNEFVRNLTTCYSVPVNTYRDVEDKRFDFGSGQMDLRQLPTSVKNSSLSIEDENFNRTQGSVSPEPFYVNLDGLHKLLFAYGNATQTGVLWKRRRWDWFGSFHFAWTIVSTIGKCFCLHGNF